MKTFFLQAAATALLCAASAALAEDAAVAPPEPAAPPAFRYGGDVRLRQEIWDDIPIPTESPAVTRKGLNNTYRLRTRVFAAYDFAEQVTANVRLTHMFYKTINGVKSFDWPDEISLDTANLAFRDLTGDGSKLVVGRQDILLGSGRLVFEGTALDAARTTFFDGVLLHQPLSGDFSADLFAVYDKDEDDFVIGHVHRQLRGYSPGVDGRDEAGAGVFLNGKLLDGSLPGSLYYIWKHETAARAADGASVPNADIHTAGILLRPKFSKTLTGEFEYARQFDPASDDGIDATLAYAGFKSMRGLKHGPPDGEDPRFGPTPQLGFGFDVTYLSGDDPDTGRNEAFNPIFSRYPFLSELMIYCFDTEGAGNWNNLIHPRVSVTAKCRGELTLAAGPVFAEERNGAGGGRDRGWLYTAQSTFLLLNGSKDGRGRTTGLFLLEVLDPGDYYVSDHTSYFFRWQVNVAF